MNKESYSSDVDSGLIPKSGPYLGSVYRDGWSELVYVEHCIPREGDAENINWRALSFMFGGYEVAAGFQNNAGRVTGGNRYFHNNIFTVGRRQGDISPPPLPPEVTLDYAVEGLYSDDLEGTGFHASHFMPWSVDQWYATVVRRWYVEGEDVTRLAMFMYAYETKKWTHYLSVSLPGRDTLMAGSLCSGRLERFGGSALGYHVLMRQYFRINEDGAWRKPWYYSASSWTAGVSRLWKAELVNQDPTVKIIAGGDFDNADDATDFRPVQTNDKPWTAVKAGVEWMAAESRPDGVYVEWRIVEDAPPQLSHVIKIHKGDIDGPVVGEDRGFTPQQRCAGFAVAGLKTGTYTASLVFTDIFNQASNIGYVSFQVP